MKKKKSCKREFEAVEQECPFTCHYAVFEKGCFSSICYCTNGTRASLVASALSYFLSSEEGVKWSKETDSKNRKEHAKFLKREFGIKSKKENYRK